ncbi:Crp/Fnr family transcriptional regulator [Meiothermus sp.]|jgi:CRP-like cAMP-binding protein|uniref:Crp/Fnr family transcriptional regulator n=1 Tax=Meiothermus sp. TaxID=1955249 RepID=UPI0021DCCBCE|nr:Crp/Fnr family transcriptional regulator [Meiothermus sp.]GIW24373.1 MAG: transcriptional regulator [Meiothermus sp.]
MSYLHQPGFLERLSEHERQRLGQICPPRAYQPGELLYREGDPCQGLLILIEGQVKLTRVSAGGLERIVYVAGSGDLLGVNFLEPDALHSSSAVCLSQVMICPVAKSQIEQVSRELPNVPLRLAQVLAERVEQLEAQLEVSSAPVAFRIGRAFAWLARRFSVPDFSPWRDLPMELKQEELAAMCGTTRVTVTHTLGELRSLGLVEGTRGRYRVKLKALEDWLEGFAID